MSRRNRQSEDGECPATLGERLKPFVLILLLVVLPIALIQGFMRYMYRYDIPLSVCKTLKGKTVVERYAVPRRSRLGVFLSSKFGKDYPWIEPYLEYRHYVIPDGATAIGESAFSGYGSLRSVIIPDSVTEIGGYAFRDCKNLTDISLPEGLRRSGF